MSITRDRWRFYRLIEDELMEFDKIIPANSDQLNIVSPKLSNILNQTCIHFESLMKDIAIESGKVTKKKKDSINITKLRELFPDFSKTRVVYIKRVKDKKGEIKPFYGWSNRSPDWWGAYNKIKHNMYENWKEDAKYINAIKSVAAILICNFELEVQLNPDLNPMKLRDKTEKYENEFVSYPIWIAPEEEYTIRTDFFRYTQNGFHMAFQDFAKFKLKKYKRRK